MVGRLVDRYRRRVEDSSANNANKEDLKNFRKNLKDVIKKARTN